MRISVNSRPRQWGSIGSESSSVGAEGGGR